MTRITIPDLGGADGAQVIEVLVAVGDEVSIDQPLVTLEGDKATMEVPATVAGKITNVHLTVGATVSSGDVCVELEAKAPAQTKTSSASTPDEVTSKEIHVPDLGGASAQVIEVLVAAGDTVTAEQALITLEGDKATMEVPSPYSGELASVFPKVGDHVQAGDLVGVIAVQQSEIVTDNATQVSPAPADVAAVPVAEPAVPAQPKLDTVLSAPSNKMVYASPSVRRYAAHYGVDLARVKGSGTNARILKEDVTSAIIALVQAAQSGSIASGQAPAAAKPTRPMPDLGEHEVIELSKIKQVSGRFLTDSWQQIPHVTQQDQADVTKLEAYRASLKSKGTKVSPLIFMMKAVAQVLSLHPNFNSVLSEDGSKLYLKQAINIGVAVDTPKGLVVPVIRDVLNKSVLALSAEVVAIAEKARTKGLTPKEMQGGSFTISSLGGIGGGHFTPIVNMPEVAILGVSKLTTVPKWADDAWVPCSMLPLSLSYDHRVIDGAEGARFITDLVKCLQDPSQACFLVANEE